MPTKSWIRIMAVASAALLFVLVSTASLSGVSWEDTRLLSTAAIPGNLSPVPQLNGSHNYEKVWDTSLIKMRAAYHVAGMKCSRVVRLNAALWGAYCGSGDGYALGVWMFSRRLFGGGRLLPVYAVVVTAPAGTPYPQMPIPIKDPNLLVDYNYRTVALSVGDVRRLDVTIGGDANVTLWDDGLAVGVKNAPSVPWGRLRSEVFEMP